MSECDRCSEHILDCRCDREELVSYTIRDILDLLFDIFEDVDQDKLSVLRCVMSGIYIANNTSTNQVKEDLQKFLNIYENTLNQMRDRKLSHDG